MKPLRQSKCFAAGLIGAILLLWCWADAFQWRTQISWQPDPARHARLVEVYGGKIEAQWITAPEWFAVRPPPGVGKLHVDRWMSSSWRLVGSSFCWVPGYQRHSQVVTGSQLQDGKPVHVSGPIVQYQFGLPIWMLLTAYIAVWWVLMGFRRSWLMRRWQRDLLRARQAADDAEEMGELPAAR